MRNKKFITLSFLLLFTVSSAFGMEGNKTSKSEKDSKYNSNKSYPIKDLVQYVNPFCGTAKDGNTYPGASAPFGMIQWSPDAGNRREVAGYNYKDSIIYGFSLDHLSGAGCYYAENFAFMPLLSTKDLLPPKNRYAFNVPFSHSNESAEPGYYSVKLDNGIKVELTATERSGFGRFTYPKRGDAVMSINAASDVNEVTLSSIHINPAEKSVSGSVVTGHFCGGGDITVVYFYAVFNKPFASYSTWKGKQLFKDKTSASGTAAGAFLVFNLDGGYTLLTKVGMSYVSAANAKANLEAENPTSEFTSKDFDNEVKEESNKWNLRLNKIQVTGGTESELKTFYTMMYHTMLGPTICSDVNGQYMGYDGKVHTIKDGRVQYANFSGWDIYRSECQFLAMIAPKDASDMAQSLLIDYQQGGAFPRWGVPNMDSGVMMGDPAAPIIADFYAFGARNFDTKETLEGLVKAATDPSVRNWRSHTHERDALADYLKLGYVPEHQRGGYGNVSMTLEYASADFGLSQFAKSLGDESDYVKLLDQAQNWQNLWNPATNFLQMRRRDGSWAPGIADSLESYDGDQAYVEGTAEQYVWMVPFNLKKLTELMGGEETAVKRLDTFFTKLNAGTKSKYAYMGNEPCLETPWIYDFLGKPYRTQKVVREIVDQLFSSEPLGFPGNDDLGEMSSWYIFSVLGMYPELPGSDILVLGSPLFPKAVLHLKNGDITIEGKNGGKNDPYVQTLKVNNKKWNKPWIRYSDISNGGNMIYDLGSAPNTKWGSSSSEAPPSYSAVK